jgi:hypothetical protein
MLRPYAGRMIRCNVAGTPALATMCRYFSRMTASLVAEYTSFETFLRGYVATSRVNEAKYGVSVAKSLGNATKGKENVATV